MADVGGALVDHGPRGRVVVVAAEGEPDRPVDELVVVAGGALLAADHPHRVVLVHRQVAAVRGRQGVAAGGDRPVVLQLAVDVDLRAVGGCRGDRDDRLADDERLGQRVVPVDAARALHPVEAPGERDRGVRGPEVARAEVERGAPVPVPRADHALGGLQLDRPLHRRLVRDRVAEAQDDRHADPVGRAFALEDLGRERVRGAERLERGGLGRGSAVGGGGGGGHRVGLRHVQRQVAAVPGGPPGGVRPGDRVARGGHGDGFERAAGRGDRDRRTGVGRLRAAAGRDRHGRPGRSRLGRGAGRRAARNGR